MTQEVILLVETELPIPMTCADDTAIPKGTLLQLGDLNTVSAISGTDDVVGGVAGSEKIADDGMVRLDVYRGGIFKAIASGSITTGDSLGSAVLSASGDNYLYSNMRTVPLSGSKIFGTSFEDATDGHSFRWELRPQAQAGIEA